MSDHPGDELDPAVWLSRARSCLALAGAGHGVADVALEDLCFQTQQCAEKALKGVLVARSVAFPRTHSIGDLLTLLQRNGLSLTDELLAAAELSVYAVITRYPGPARLTDQDYWDALARATSVLAWCAVQVGGRQLGSAEDMASDPQSAADEPGIPAEPKAKGQSTERADEDSFSPDAASEC